MVVLTGQSGADCLDGSDRPHAVIDKHLIPFTGADRYNYNFIISGKPRGGAFRFETCAAMQIVTEEQLPTIAVVRVTENMSKIEFVRKLLSESRKQGLKNRCFSWIGSLAVWR